MFPTEVYIRRPWLVLDVHRGDQRVRGVPLGDGLPGGGELLRREAVVEPQPVGVAVSAAPAEIEQVAVGDDDQALIGERLDAGVVDLERVLPEQIGVGGQSLPRYRSVLLGHPHAERQPHAVEPLTGDEPRKRTAVDAIQPVRGAHVLAGAVPVHPGQADPLPVLVDDEPAAGRQRRSDSHTHSPQFTQSSSPS
jgi:hypothetical protein